MSDETLNKNTLLIKRVSYFNINNNTSNKLVKLVTNQGYSIKDAAIMTDVNHSIARFFTSKFKSKKVLSKKPRNEAPKSVFIRCSK
uniref:Transposase n=1 Tax=Strongyloides stercoralis TaxID=6248 RepID=A0A0K0E5E7_STRER